MDLSDVAVGDVLAISSNFQNLDALKKVTKVTATQVHCDTRKFAKRSGREVGMQGYAAFYAEKAGPHHYRAVRIARMQQWLRTVKVTHENVDEIEALKEALLKRQQVYAPEIVAAEVTTA